MAPAPRTHDPVADRRPLKVRDALPWDAVARGCVRLGLTPNTISVIGLCLGIASGMALVATAMVGSVLSQRLSFLTAVVLVAGRGACNILDGVVAVNTAKTSPFGLLYNEVPDRIADAAAMIGAGFAVGGTPTLGWAAAGVAVFVAYVRTQAVVARGADRLRRPDGQARAHGGAVACVDLHRGGPGRLAARLGAVRRLGCDRRRPCDDCHRWIDHGRTPSSPRRFGAE